MGEIIVDVYKLDADLALASYNELVHLSDKFTTALGDQKRQADDASKKLTQLEKSSQSAGSAISNHLMGSILGATTGIGFAIKAIDSFIGFIGDSVHEAMEAERADIRLADAITRAGFSAEQIKGPIDEMAKAFEHMTGVSDETIKELDQLFLTLGVGPDQLKTLTEATLNYAAFAQKDVITAGKEVIGVIRGEQDNLGRLKFDLEGAEGATDRVTVVTKILNSELRGQAESQMQGSTKAVKELGVAWGETKETVGKYLTMFGVQLAHNLALTEILEKVSGGAKDVSASMLKATEDLSKFKKASDGGEKDPLGDLVEADKARAAAHEKWKKARAERIKQEDIDFQDRLDMIREFGEESIQAQDENFQEELDALREWDEEQAAELERGVAEQKKILDDHWSSTLSSLQGFGNSFVNMGAQFLQRSLTTNNRYTDAYRKGSIERRVADLAELGIHKDKAAVAKELADEEGAAAQQRVADTLASIATQSAIKAIFELAEGFANITAPPIAAAHFTSAAIFGGLAVAAGGTAYALTQGRGQTTSERESLESQERDKRDREERNEREESNASTTNKNGGGPGVSVYYFGITGFTEAEQARELSRIQNKYKNLQTGA